MQLALDYATPRIRPTSPRGALERRITRALGVPVELVVTDNRRTMISTRRQTDHLVVRLHHMFLDAPEAVLEELLCYLADGDARSSRRLGRFIEANRTRIQKPSRRVHLRARGAHHDLSAILAEVIGAYAPDAPARSAPPPKITWGKRPSSRRRRRRSIRLGTYTHDQALIRVHPALDQAFVPRWFVAFVVFHELLHHVVPPLERAGRLDYHPAAFRTRERAHPDYYRALRWETEHLEALLAYSPT